MSRHITTRITMLLGLLAVTYPLAANAQAFPGPKIKDAPPGSIRVLATVAIMEPLEAVRLQAERAIGKAIVIEYGSARGNLKDKVLAGDAFDAAILLPDVDDGLVAAGKGSPERYPIASVDTAIGLRGDVESVDVSTPAALREALLKARSVKYSPTGVSLYTVRKLLDQFDIADKIHDSSHATTQVELGKGEYKIDLFPVSEILANKKLRNLGRVIEPLQVPTVIEAIIGSHAADRTATLKLIRFFQSAALDTPLRAAGMDRPPQK